jgi:hypothetical protein
LQKAALNSSQGSFLLKKAKNGEKRSNLKKRGKSREEEKEVMN